MKRVHVFIIGKVTGVFFRVFIRERALELGLNGWVKNFKEDTVEAVFEGGDDKINKILGYCKKGPNRALVKKVEIVEEETKGEKSFVVR